jgi:hypothetical protein
MEELTPNKVGRPSSYTQELADTICERLAMGESMRTVSKDENMPAMSTMFKWLRENPSFSEQYARAKQESADAMAEEILDIADDGTNDYMTIELQDGYEKEVINHEVLARSRLRVDTRKWLMSKMKPKKYGEKIDMTSDGKAIMGNGIVFSNFKNATDSQSGV